MLVYITLVGRDRFSTAFFGIRQYRSDTFSALFQSPFNTAPISLKYLSKSFQHRFIAVAKSIPIFQSDFNVEDSVKMLKCGKCRKKGNPLDNRRMPCERV